MPERHSVLESHLQAGGRDGVDGARSLRLAELRGWHLCQLAAFAGTDAALRAQLQPHFLFNTLNGIAAASRTEPELATRMLTLLGDLLRDTLRERNGELVALDEERRVLQPYVELQQLRFGDRLRIEFDVPEVLRT